MCSHVEVVFITGHEEDWWSGKRKRKLKGARQRKRSKHFLISSLPSPLTLLFYSFSRPCFPRFIDWLHELKIKFELSDNSFFQFSPRNFSCFFFKSAFLWSLTHFPPCCSRYCVRTSCGTKIERTKKGKGERKKEQKKTDCCSHFLQNIYDGCTTPQSKLSSWWTFLVSNLPSAPSRSKCEKLRVTIFPSGTRITYEQSRDTGWLSGWFGDVITPLDPVNVRPQP